MIRLLRHNCLLTVTKTTNNSLKCAMKPNTLHLFHINERFRTPSAFESTSFLIGGRSVAIYLSMETHRKTMCISAATFASHLPHFRSWKVKVSKTGTAMEMLLKTAQDVKFSIVNAQLGYNSCVLRLICTLDRFLSFNLGKFAVLVIPHKESTCSVWCERISLVRGKQSAHMHGTLWLSPKYLSVTHYNVTWSVAYSCVEPLLGNQSGSIMCVVRYFVFEFGTAHSCNYYLLANINWS